MLKRILYLRCYASSRNGTLDFLELNSQVHQKNPLFERVYIRASQNFMRPSFSRVRTTKMALNDNESSLRSSAEGNFETVPINFL